MEQLMEMSYPMYTRILGEITKKIMFESYSNLYGNAYAGEKGMDVIKEANPLKDLMGDGTHLRRLTRRDLGKLQKIKRV